MSWFEKLRIRKKLLLGFISIAVITIITGYIGIQNVNKVNHGSEEMFFHNTVPLSHIIELTEHFQRLRANASTSILENDPQKIDIQIQKAKDRMASMKLYEDKFDSTINSDDIRSTFMAFKDAQGKLLPVLDRLFELAKQNEDQQATDLLTGDVEALRTPCQNALIKLKDLQAEHSRIQAQANDDISNTATMFLIGISIFGFLIAVTLGFFISKQISNPIIKLADGADKVASGDYNTIIHVSSKDEIGALADSFNTMTKSINKANDIIVKEKDSIGVKVEQAVKESEAQKEYLVESIDHILIEMNKFAEGDLTVDLEIKKDDEIGKLYRGFNKAVQNIKNMLVKVSESVASTASASSQISASSEEMAAGAQEQSSQTMEVASAVEEMAKTIFETTKNSSTASEAAKKSGIIAKEGGRVVRETIEGMNRVAEVVKKSAETVQALGKSSNAIGEIIQVIDDIADQTNLLALNAAIEAARAGEQGRGFAVVADEVRKLAERTTKATKEIASMIKQIQKDTEGAVQSMKEGTDEVERGKQLADKAGSSLSQIIKGTDEVVDISIQVAAASEEQSASAEQISKNIEAITNVTQESTAGIQQIARASEDLSRLTLILQDLISQFKISNARGTGSVHANEQSSKSRLAVRSNGKIVNS